MWPFGTCPLQVCPIVFDRLAPVIWKSKFHNTIEREWWENMIWSTKDKDNDSIVNGNDKDIDYVSGNWEYKSMTIIVTWQLRVTLDSIRHSCNASRPSLNYLQLFWQTGILSEKENSFRNLLHIVFNFDYTNHYVKYITRRGGAHNTIHIVHLKKSWAIVLGIRVSW